MIRSRSKRVLFRGKKPLRLSNLVNVFYGDVSMATTSKVNPPVRGYAKRTSPSEVCTSDLAPKTAAPPISTTEDVIRELLATGILLEQILIPGQGKNDVLFMADDFNDPCDEFADKTRWMYFLTRVPSSTFAPMTRN